MDRCIVRTIGVLLGNGATLMTLAIFAMPYWRLAIIIETNSYGKRLDGHWIGRWDGLWMTCVRHGRQPISCEFYSHSISMTPDLKAARMLMAFALMVAVSGCVCSFIGMLFNKCFAKNKRNRRCFFLLAGMSFFMAGILVLAPVIWVIINIMKEVCVSNCTNVQQQQIGECIMLAWPTVMFFFIGGSIFCWYHPCICSKKGCTCLTEDDQPDDYEGENRFAQELQVLKPNRRQNQDIVI
ncbi:claudin-8-like [Eleutherodactylus coqui]|uniref:claudin-8-like n=1 Tax=Eleutherodactylus coqui TaxID=57060 RepID=UPI003462FE03